MSRTPKNKIIKIDYDSTIDKAGYPNVGRIDAIVIDTINELKEHNTIILDTCRKDSALQEAVSYMKAFGLEFHYVNKNDDSKIEAFGDTRKIYADLSIDDKNLFTPLVGGHVDWARVRESLGLGML